MIFVVEDDSNIRDLVTYTLQSTGFEAKGFENGTDFLKTMEDGEMPELVLLDIMLPGEDGISILGKLRKKSATKELPIIMMTAKGSAPLTATRKRVYSVLWAMAACISFRLLPWRWATNRRWRQGKPRYWQTWKVR